ncbi:MAG: hypothetical protein CMF48_05020 [Legionellales bacterium]|nr:hypothetical protein [Legionellales bacterium]|tara:strand:- start:2610 stop:3005 length:396 start_codon:yes stop_codon:yes gene_type:complete
MKTKHQLYEFHHFGIPTKEKKPNERYSPTFKMYTTPGNNPFRVQYHRFEEGCPLHPLLQTQPHVAFKVPNLDDAIEGEKILLEPYEPFAGFKVAVIQVEDSAIELIETNLPEDKIWDDKAHENSVIYPKRK